MHISGTQSERTESCYMKQRDQVIVEKILEYCGEIEAILSRLEYSEDAFLKDKGLSAGTVFYIAQIGELSAHFSEEFREAHNEIPWREIKGMRNILIHEYHTASPKTIWETATEDIPALQAMLAHPLKHEKRD